jgi:UDP-N-acetylmuramyl tripeptide synthase
MRILETFNFLGTNPRSNTTVIDRIIAFDESEMAAFAAVGSRGKCLSQVVQDVFPDLTNHFPKDSPGAERPEDALSVFLSKASVGLQRLAGHRVSELGIVCEERPLTSHAYFEFEDLETGQQSAALAQHLLEILLANDRGTHQEALTAWREDLKAFIETAMPRAMPGDTHHILLAARHRAIPCSRMDRPPFEPPSGRFRVRAHSLLRLGHGSNQRTVDGTLCVELSEAAHPLLWDRRRLYERLGTLNAPLPSGQWSPRFCLTPDKAVRTAEHRGYPVALRGDQRRTGKPPWLNLTSASEVRTAATEALQQHESILVEPFIQGTAYHLIVVGGQFLDALAELPATAAGKPVYRRITELHQDTKQLCEHLASSLRCGVMTVTIVTTDPTENLRTSGGALVDVDIAPALDRIYEHSDPMLKQVAERFIDWMFPASRPTRIPVVAVTGTNGKTTTCRMVARIMDYAGYHTGLACSDGTYIAGERLSSTEDGQILGHLSVLDHRGVNLAVLESTRGGAGSSGLGYDRCDVAACLNVTPDHLNDRLGLRTLDQMADLKRWIVDRAERGIALNADDPRCLSMVPHLTGRRIALSSLHTPGPQLLELAGPKGVAVVLEHIGQQPWLVLYQSDGRTPMVRIDEIPATFGGHAQHNISNAFHAAALCHLMGASPQAISAGLTELECTFDSLPGRLTVCRGLPFDVIMDYAHNPDGVAHISRFTDQLEVSGRRLVAISCSAQNSDQFIRDTAATAAGHFDHFICKNYGELYGRAPEECPALLREGLLSKGVPSGAITCIPDEFEATRAALSMGRPGDLVLILAGKRKQAIWELITSFTADEAAQDRRSNNVGQRSPSS